MADATVIFSITVLYDFLGSSYNGCHGFIFKRKHYPHIISTKCHPFLHFLSFILNNFIYVPFTSGRSLFFLAVITSFTMEPLSLIISNINSITLL